MVNLNESTAPTDFSSDTDEELLFYMSLREEDSDAAREAFAVFYNRHIHYLSRVCGRAHKDTLGEAGIIDLVQDTFLRAYEKAEKFTAENANDPDQCRKQVRAWLGTIATNIFRDYFRRKDPLSLINDEELDSPDHQRVGNEGDTPDPDSPMLRLLQEGLETLPDREQDILRITAAWYQPGQENQRLPNNVSAELAKRYETTSENIRKIRSRAMKKLKQYVESRMH